MTDENSELTQSMKMQHATCSALLAEYGITVKKAEGGGLSESDQKNAPLFPVSMSSTQDNDGGSHKWTFHTVDKDKIKECVREKYYGVYWMIESGFGKEPSERVRSYIDLSMESVVRSVAMFADKLDDRQKEESVVFHCVVGYDPNVQIYQNTTWFKFLN